MPDPVEPITHWLCPVCKQTELSKPLQWHSHAWRCDAGHSFDRAKEAYVNLLLVQHKNSKDPGDNKEMVLARREFLAQDHYLPLAQQIASLLQSCFAQQSTNGQLALFDAGCGEGYYLAKIKQDLALAGLSVTASGSDISKSAIQKAAKKHPDIHYAVASSYNLPVASESQDGVIQVFAPSNAAEIQRILKTQGWWVDVNPAADHLFALKQQVYDKPEKHTSDEGIPTGFKLVSQSRLSFTIELLNQQQRQNLLMMTPFYWTISEQKKQLLLQNLSSVTTDFDIKLMQKTAEVGIN